MATTTVRSRAGHRHPGRCAAWLSLSLALVVQPVLTGQSADNTRTVTAAVLADWPPYFVSGENGRPSGFAVDVFDAVAARAGLVPRYVTFPSYAPMLTALGRGEIDVVTDLGILPGRDFIFTSTVHTFQVSVFTRASSPNISALGDVRGSVAVVETNIGESLVSMLPEGKVVVLPGVRDALFRLLAGDVDAVVHPAPVVWALARRAGVDHEITELTPALTEVKRGIALAPGHDELRNRLDGAVRALIGSGQYATIYRRWHPPPAGFWTAGRLGLLAGAIVALLGLVAGGQRLVTSRRHTQALRARERTFRGLAEALSDCVMIVSPDDGTVQYVNSRCDEMFGRPSEAIVGRSVREILTEDYSTSGQDHPLLARVRRSDGTSFEAEITVGPSLLEAVPAGYLLRVADVTARRRADERIRFQAQLLDMIGEAVIAVNTDGKVLFWNRFAEKLYGWTSEEALARPASTLNTPGGGRGEAGSMMERVWKGEAWTGEVMTSKRDGTTFPVLATLTPIRDDSGAVVGIVGVSTDLSERKVLEEQLLQAQKMESIGRLAGGIAHDFNNLLTVIAGNAQLVFDRLPEGDARRDDLLEVCRASERAADLTRQLLAFGRKQLTRPTVLDPAATLSGMRGMLQRLIGEDIALVVSAAPGVGNVLVDAIQLEQVIMNLAVNSRDAMPDGGTLTIATAHTEFDQEYIDRHGAGVAPGSYVMLAVTDTGIGITAGVRERLFEPFFTTKEVGRGTGLGLATVYGIVKQHGGFIEVHSEPGAGATFKVYLPRAAEVASQTAVRENGAAAGTETILVVEDESSLRHFIERALKGLGYTVLTAGTPTEALDIATRHAGSIDLVISDVVMPEMRGPELVRRLGVLRPTAAVLYISGYPDGGLTSHDLNDASTHLLGKPFDRATLSRRVRDVLDQATPVPPGVPLQD